MINKTIQIGLVTLVSLSIYGCGSAKYVTAPNSKLYFVDTKTCTFYKMAGDTMYCYEDSKKCFATAYKPVESGCNTDKYTLKVNEFQTLP